MSSQVADYLGLQVDLHRISKGFGEEENSFAIVRPVGAFAEPGEPLNVGGQVVRWIVAGGGRADSGAEGKGCCREQENGGARSDGFHDANFAETVRNCQC